MSALTFNAFGPSRGNVWLLRAQVEWWETAYWVVTLGLFGFCFRIVYWPSVSR